MTVTILSSETEDLRLPDFIIAGAMKSGTTSLHQILAQHPEVFIPDEEVFFFDIDDITQHPDFFARNGDSWIFHDFENQRNEYLQWYASFFRDASYNQMVGEDSTTYLASEKAPQRIGRILPEAKLIIMLRDPASRTYSHYWHLVRTGRAIYNFEDTLQYIPGTLLQRSMYKQQIQYYLKYFNHSQLKFVLFEEFIRKTQQVIDEVCDFLQLSETINVNQIETHYNRSRIPLSLNVILFRNRLLRRRALSIYAGRLLQMPDTSAFQPGIGKRLLDKAFKAVNPPLRKKSPSMKAGTRRFLNELFANENDGLEELIGCNLYQYWYREP